MNHYFIPIPSFWGLGGAACFCGVEDADFC